MAEHVESRGPSPAELVDGLNRTTMQGLSGRLRPAEPNPLEPRIERIDPPGNHVEYRIVWLGIQNFVDIYREERARVIQGLTATEITEIIERGGHGRIAEMMAAGASYGTPPLLRPAPDTPTGPTAHEKAWKLLNSKLDKKQREMMEKEGYFEHEGKAGTYRFLKDNFSGVQLLTKQLLGGREIITEYELCIQSSDPNMPQGDVILAKHLELKADEDKFLKTCNVRKAKTRDEAMGGGNIEAFMGAGYMVQWGDNTSIILPRVESEGHFTNIFYNSVVIFGLMTFIYCIFKSIFGGQ